MPTVALYGNSLVLASIGARIERRTGLRPAIVDAALPGAIEKLSALQPDFVVFDLGTPHPDPIVAFWRARPEVQLIGVDIDADRMLILSGQPARALTAEVLIETLTTHMEGEIK